MEFAHPALLIGALAAALPLVIHLLLRPRPRRARFPAVVFLRDALFEGRRMQRVRDVGLLAARAALLALIATLLAAPTCRQRGLGNDAGAPLAAVLVLDDSWSTAVQLPDGTSVLDHLRAAASAWLDAARGWPDGSRVGVVTAGGATELAPTPDRGAVRAALAAGGRPPTHARTLSAALERAAGWLGAASEPRRRLVVFSDLAAHAWRDVRAGLLAAVPDAQVELIGPATRVGSNLALLSATAPARVVSSAAPIPLRVELRCEGVPVEAVVLVREADAVLARSEPATLAAGQAQSLDLLVPPLPPGLHGLAVSVEPADRQPADQTRYVAVETGPSAVVWFIGPRESNGAPDLSALLLENLLAPASLPRAQQRVRLGRFAGGEGLPSGADLAEPPRLIVLLADVPLPDPARDALHRAVDSGATLLLAPRSDASEPDWPGFRSLVASEAPTVEALDAPLTMRWTDAVDAPAQSDGLGPLDALDEMTRAPARRRLRLTPRAGSITLAAYDDGAPAIVATRLGAGRIVALTTSPDPLWSELGRQAAGLLAWLHALVDQAAAAPARVLALTVHAESSAALPQLADGPAPIARVDGPNPADGDRLPASLLITAGAPRGGWPAVSPGLLRVGPLRDPAGLVALNWPAAESIIEPIGPERGARVLGISPERLAIGAPERIGAAETASRWPAALARPGDWLAAALLALLCAEVALSRPARAAARAARPGAPPA